MEEQKELQFPYGAVYFRKSNPPRSDWERDYEVASADSCNLFRHWLIWGAVETAPGIYDWSDYDRQLELAEKNGIKVILAEITTSVPAWAAARSPELFPEDIHRNRCMPEMAGNSAVGGFPHGFCLDKPAAAAMVKAFLEAAAEHFRGHPALYGYDISNECYRRPDMCYCEDTVREYRIWLKKKYETIEAVNQCWHIYSLTDFNDIFPPYRLGFFPDSVDWLQFRHEKTYETIQWKIDLIRAADPKALITAHGMSDCFSSYSEQCSDHWTAAKKVDVYGITWVPCRKGNEAWRHFYAFDLLKSACGDTPFWHTEAQGGPLWLQPQLTGRSRQDGRVPDKEDIRIWNLMVMACGGRGIVYTRWRPLLDGPLFDGFAPYAMDGSRTDRSIMASQIACWANAPEQKPLWEARPVRGDVHILFVPECETASYLLSQSGGARMYASMMEGAYEGFFSQNIQADFVHIDEIEKASVVYFPFPLALSEEHSRKLISWVERGGILISEACPGFFTEHMHGCAVQPGQQMNRLFGVRQAAVEFMPDLAGEVRFELFGETVQGGGFTQFYELEGGTKAAAYQECVIAAENHFGAGRTLLLGTAVSGGGTENRGIWKRMLEYFGIQPRVRLSAPDMTVRLHYGSGRYILWIVNPGRERRQTEITLEGAWRPGTVYWNGGDIRSGGNGTLEAAVDPRNALAVELLHDSDCLNSL